MNRTDDDGDADDDEHEPPSSYIRLDDLAFDEFATGKGSKQRRVKLERKKNPDSTIC